MYMGLALSPSEQNDLIAITRHQRGEARFHRRARMVLLAAEGESIAAIAPQLGTCRGRVTPWLERLREHRMEGLGDLPRSGRPPEITPAERHQVIATACRTPSEFGNDDRVRLTRMSTATYGLSVKRHIGRWERTPFTGTMEELVDTIMGCMQHLVAAY